MTDTNQKQLGNSLWKIADDLRGAMNADYRNYKKRREEPRYSRRVEMSEIEKNDFNLNISRYISTAVGEKEIDLSDIHKQLVSIDESIRAATAKHNTFLKELGLPPLP